MSNLADRLNAVVSQFAEAWMATADFTQLQGIPPEWRASVMHGMAAERWGPGETGSLVRALLEDLFQVLPPSFQGQSVEARVQWLMADFLQASAQADVETAVGTFIGQVTAATQRALHSLTFGGLELADAAAGQRLPLVRGWEAHIRGMPLDSQASFLASRQGGAQSPVSLTRFVEVDKGSDLGRLVFESWWEAQIILEAFRLFGLNGCFVLQEDFSPDFPFVRPYATVPSSRPVSTGQRRIPVARWEELRAFVALWLQTTPSERREKKTTQERARLRQALWRLRGAYAGTRWHESVLDAVSGLELLLVDETQELSFRLAVRAAHILSALEPGTASVLYAEVRHLYDVRSCIAHGDWEAASTKAAKYWPVQGTRPDAPGVACAGSAIDLLRKAILCVAYALGNQPLLTTLRDDGLLLNPKTREELQRLLVQDADNPLVRALARTQDWDAKQMTKGAARSVLPDTD